MLALRSFSEAVVLSAGVEPASRTLGRWRSIHWTTKAKYYIWLKDYNTKTSCDRMVIRQLVIRQPDEPLFRFGIILNPSSVKPSGRRISNFGWDSSVGCIPSEWRQTTDVQSQNMYNYIINLKNSQSYNKTISLLVILTILSLFFHSGMFFWPKKVI